MRPTPRRGSHGRPGRPRDDSRDAAVLLAAGDVLAEVGYERLTMDAVAARAGTGKATIYRRWSSKSALIADVVATLAPPLGPLAEPPDTGSLRGDLLALASDNRRAETRALRIAGTLLASVPNDPSIAQVVTVILAPQRQALVDAFTRALGRGEIPAGHDVAVLAKVGHAMLYHRVMVEGGHIDDSFMLELIDQVIIPLATSQPHTARETIK